MLLFFDIMMSGLALRKDVSESSDARLSVWIILHWTAALAHYDVPEVVDVDVLVLIKVQQM